MDFPTNGCALVAGGSGGIGRAVIRRLAESGCDVAFTYRANKESADAALQEVSARGQAGYAIQVALEDDKAVAEAIGHAVGALGPLHTLVYAAGPYIDMRYISQPAWELRGGGGTEGGPQPPFTALCRRGAPIGHRGCRALRRSRERRR